MCNDCCDKLFEANKTCPLCTAKLSHRTVTNKQRDITKEIIDISDDDNDDDGFNHEAAQWTRHSLPMEFQAELWGELLLRNEEEDDMRDDDQEDNVDDDDDDDK